MLLAHATSSGAGECNAFERAEFASSSAVPSSRFHVNEGGQARSAGECWKLARLPYDRAEYGEHIRRAVVAQTGTAAGGSTLCAGSMTARQAAKGIRCAAAIPDGNIWFIVCGNRAFRGTKSVSEMPAFCAAIGSLHAKSATTHSVMVLATIRVAFGQHLFGNIGRPMSGLGQDRLTHSEHNESAFGLIAPKVYRQAWPDNSAKGRIVTNKGRAGLVTRGRWSRKPAAKRALAVFTRCSHLARPALHRAARSVLLRREYKLIFGGRESRQRRPVEHKLFHESKDANDWADLAARRCDGQGGFYNSPSRRALGNIVRYEGQ
jgi:hypothetical protein